MRGRILIAFATRAGSTEGIASAIAEEFSTSGYDINTVLINDKTELKGYDHIILGGPIYMGAMNEVKDFIRRNEDAVGSRLLGAFAVGMSFAGDDEEMQAPARDALKNAIAPLKPKYYGYFAGMTDPKKLSFLQRTALRIVTSPIGDFRDWEAIRGWTQEIIRELQKEMNPS